MSSKYILKCFKILHKYNKQNLWFITLLSSLSCHNSRRHCPPPPHHHIIILHWIHNLLYHSINGTLDMLFMSLKDKTKKRDWHFQLVPVGSKLFKKTAIFIEILEKTQGSLKSIYLTMQGNMLVASTNYINSCEQIICWWKNGTHQIWISEPKFKWTTVNLLKPVHHYLSSNQFYIL